MLLALPTLPLPTLALPTLPLAAGAVASEAVIEEIIVTATKREASIQDIPASISQVSGQELEDLGINSIESLSQQIPNLQYGAFGSNGFVTIRGIGTTVDSGVAEPAVSTYVDGVFLPRSTMSVLRQVDLDRVEVLRGPQGTLYGRNATGGSINFISRAPASEFESGIRLLAEDRNGYGVSGYLSGPVSDTISYRVSLGREEQDGYVDVRNSGEDLVGTDLWFGRAALQFRPSEDLVIDLSLQYEESDGPLSLQQLLTRNVVVDALSGGANQQTTEINETFGDGNYDGDAETTIASLRLEWDLSQHASFRSITGYVDHEISSSYDADATDFYFVDLVNAQRPSESFSQEFNLFGDTERLSWLVGAYYFEEDFTLSLPVSFVGVGLINAGILEEETESFALFTDITFHVTDRFRVNAGARYNEEEKDFRWSNAPFDPVPVPDGGLEADDVLPKLGLQFDLSENINAYGQWQKGIKSGGHQLSLPAQFDPEELDAYEIGLKSRLLDGRLTANAAAFVYDYQDLQATTTIPPTTTLVRNADAEVSGLELEVDYALSANLVLELAFSLLDSEYQDFAFFDQFSGQTVDLDGEALIRAPEYTVNLGAEWAIPLDNALLSEVVVRGDVYRSDDYKLTFIDYPQTRQDAYTTGNASVTFISRNQSVQVRAFVNNIGDEETLNNGSFLATNGAFIGYYSEPRTYGISVIVDL